MLVHREIRVQLGVAVGTNSMRELRVRVGLNVLFEIFPIAFVATYLLTIRADRNQSAQSFYARHRFFNPRIEIFLSFQQLIVRRPPRFTRAEESRSF